MASIFIHYVRCRSPNNPELFIDVRVIDAISFTKSNGDEQVLLSPAKNASPTIVDQTAGNNGVTGANPTRVSHMTLVQGQDDGPNGQDNSGNSFYIEVLDGVSFYERNGDEYVLLMPTVVETAIVSNPNNLTYVAPNDTVVTGGSGSRGGILTRVDDGSSNPPNTQYQTGINPNATQNYLTVYQPVAFSFYARNGDAENYVLDLGATIANGGVIDSTVYDTDPSGNQIPPGNRFDQQGNPVPVPPGDPDIYVAFNPDSGGFITGNVMINQGLLWQIVKVSIPGIFVAVAIDPQGNEHVLYSKGGVNWENLGNFGLNNIIGLVSPINTDPNHPLSGAGTFVISGTPFPNSSSGAKLLTSTDGKKWTATYNTLVVDEVVYSPQAQAFYCGAVTSTGTDHLDIVVPNSVFLISPDGLSWTTFIYYTPTTDPASDFADPALGGALSAYWAPPGAGFEILANAPGIDPITFPQPIYGTTGGAGGSGVMAWWTFSGGVFFEPAVGGLSKNPYGGINAALVYTDAGGNQTTVICNGSTNPFNGISNTVTVTAPDGSQITATLGGGMINATNCAVSQGVFVVTDESFSSSFIAVCNGGPTSDSFKSENWLIVDITKNTDTRLPDGSAIFLIAGQATAK
jgi:hypothetical protein